MRSDAFKWHLVLWLLSGTISINGQQLPAPPTDTLSATEQRKADEVERLVATQLRQLQRLAHSRVMRKLPPTERNKRLACTLAWTGSLKEREGTDVGVISFVSAAPDKDPALQKLVEFPNSPRSGEYSLRHFDVSAWPVRASSQPGSFAVRIEMRQGLYYDWADSHITDDSLNKDWWRKVIVPQCK
jgi:hypothetical protein